MFLYYLLKYNTHFGSCRGERCILIKNVKLEISKTFEKTIQKDCEKNRYI